MSGSGGSAVITVEVKVIGSFGAESVAVEEPVELVAGARVLDALEGLYRRGAISKPVFKAARKLRPPLFLVLNDEKVEGKGMKRQLCDGDVVTVMQLMAGG